MTISSRNVNHFQRMLKPTSYIPAGLTKNLKFQQVLLVQVLGNYHKSFKDRPLVHNRLNSTALLQISFSMACI